MAEDAVRLLHNPFHRGIAKHPSSGQKRQGKAPKVVNIMDALKKSMQAKGQMKVKDSVRKRMGKPAPKRVVTSSRSRSSAAANRSLVLTFADQFPAHFSA